MNDYIKRKELLDELCRDNCERTYDGTCHNCRMTETIADFPAADVVKVKHGIWIGIEYDGYADGYPVYDLWECSECGEEVRGDDVPSTHPWCHSCGARMDKEDDHEIAKP